MIKHCPRNRHVIDDPMIMHHRTICGSNVERIQIANKTGDINCKNCLRWIGRRIDRSAWSAGSTTPDSNGESSKDPTTFGP
jgi:hypothetical protein